jgi:hypothetical protein
MRPDIQALADEGFALIVVPAGTKGGSGQRPWRNVPAHRVADFGPDDNVAFLNGANGLTDIDLDHPMAVALAKHLLPPTRVYGRGLFPSSLHLSLDHREGVRVHRHARRQEERKGLRYEL